MQTVKITTSWHKATDKIAITHKQLEYIGTLRNDENCPDWPFNSATNAMRSLTKYDASTMIDAFKAGNKIVFK